MAFTLGTFTRTSTSMAAASAINFVSGVVAQAAGISIYNYKTADTLGQVLAAGYFFNTAGTQLVQIFAPGDVIFVEAADGATSLTVATVNFGAPATPAAAAIAPSITFTNAGQVMTTDTVITSAQLLAVAILAGVAVTDDPPAGFKVDLMSMSATVNFNTTAYNAVTWTFAQGGVTLSSVVAATLMQAVATSTASPIRVAAFGLETAFAGLPVLFIPNVQPTTGDSPLLVRTTYRLIPTP